MTPTDQVSWHEVTGKMKPLPSIGIVLQTFFMEFYLWSSSLPKAKMKCFKSSPNLLWWITIFPFFWKEEGFPSLTWPKFCFLFSCRALWSIILTWIIPTTPRKKMEHHQSTTLQTMPNLLLLGPDSRISQHFSSDVKHVQHVHQQNPAKKSMGFLVDLNRSWIQLRRSFLLRGFVPWKSKGPNPDLWHHMLGLPVIG